MRDRMIRRMIKMTTITVSAASQIIAPSMNSSDFHSSLISRTHTSFAKLVYVALLLEFACND